MSFPDQSQQFGSSQPQPPFRPSNGRPIRRAKPLFSHTNGIGTSGIESNERQNWESAPKPAPRMPRTHTRSGHEHEEQDENGCADCCYCFSRSGDECSECCQCCSGDEDDCSECYTSSLEDDGDDRDNSTSSPPLYFHSPNPSLPSSSSFTPYFSCLPAYPSNQDEDEYEDEDGDEDGDEDENEDKYEDEDEDEDGDHRVWVSFLSQM
ncbi:hypothetical protein F5B18DRAFT_251080 [Nemania serpens]|nr:hypothetical protein F5B18DRAFT_251080 [Nemania serpens]